MAPASDPVERYIIWLFDNHRLVVLILGICLISVGSGIFFIDNGIEIGQFEVESSEAEADQYIQGNFELEKRSFSLVIVRGDNVLERDVILQTMDFQRDVRQNPTIGPTLVEEPATVGLGNALAATAEPIDWLGEDTPTIEEKQSIVAAIPDGEYYSLVGTTLRGHRFAPVAHADPASLLPRDHEPGTQHADAMVVLVVHDADTAKADLLAAQEEVELLADDSFDDVVVFSEDLAFERAAVATAHSFGIVGPIFFIFVILLLAIVYRNALDVALAVLGIGLVVGATAGFIGWASLPVNQLLAAVPFLLIGLSIDYWIHYVMRYRETLQTGSIDVTIRGLASVIAAISVTSITTAIGFLSGLTSPIAILRTFGLTAAVGLIIALIVFGAFIPALKIWVGQRGITVGSVTPIAALTIGRPFARLSNVIGRYPITILTVCVLIAIAGGIAAPGLDMSSERSDFMPASPDESIVSLPGPLLPPDHDLRYRSAYVDERFDDVAVPTVNLLVRGDVTDPATVAAMEDARLVAHDWGVVAFRGVKTPVDVLEEIARYDEDFAATLEAADTSGDGIPDRNLAGVYDDAFAADPERAATVLHRDSNGSYRAALVRVVLDREADQEETVVAMRAMAATIEGGGDVESIATGSPVREAVDQGAVWETAVRMFIFAVVVIGAVLTVAFRRRHGSWFLGPATMVPVIVALGWLFAMMWAFNLPYNAETVIITGIAIGLGVDYAVHVTERFSTELQNDVSMQSALDRTILQTGGAILSSMATTALAFATLYLTIIPSLQRFGIITALAVLLAFLSSVVVLPTLLVIWVRGMEAD